MKQAYKYDAEGKYIEPVMLEEDESLPANCTDIPLPQPNWKPVFINGKWMETATEEEKNPPIIAEATPLEKLQQEQELMRQALDELILGGGGL
jgi:hypothetical protein